MRIKKLFVNKILILTYSLIGLISAFAVNKICLAQLTIPTPQTQKQLKWYKGNTHTHTVNSDGDSTPDEVVRWYREHDYHFLVLTDHNFLTEIDGLNSIFQAKEQFILIRGEEITERVGDKPVHINGLDVEREVRPQGGKNVAEVLQRNVNEIRAAKGVPHINHPNYGWAITAEELKQVENNKLFEIFNGHPQTNLLGGGGLPGLEQMWDAILSSGKLLYGIAVDDAHHFKPPFDKNSSTPGRGWIYVRAEQLSPRAILQALESGDFYASTGVELKDYQVTEKQITITINEVKTSKYRIQFIGNGGDVLSEVLSSPAIYQFRGNEKYVRARIIESNGKMAWTQPVMFGKK